MNKHNESAQLVATQHELYKKRYAKEKRLNLTRFPLDFLDVRLRRVWQLLPPSPKILDLGCGSGQLLLRQRPPGACRYTGIDITYTGLTQAQEAVGAAYPGSGFVQSPASRLPLAAGAFDVIFAISLIEHVPDPEHLLDECARVLRANGLLVLHTPNLQDAFTADGLLRRLAPKLYARRGQAVGHDYDRFIAPPRLTHMMRQRGLQVIGLQYTDTLVEWLWVHAVWPAALALAHRAIPPSPGAQGGAPLSPAGGCGAMKHAIRLYNSVFFPLLRLMCWPDRLIEQSGHSGGYLVTARKGA